jgi:hypothetical protein
MTPSIREQVKVNLHPEHMCLLKDVWEHKVWSGLDRHAGRWPKTFDARYPAKSSDHCELVDDYDNLEDGEPLGWDEYDSDEGTEEVEDESENWTDEVIEEPVDHEDASRDENIY